MDVNTVPRLVSLENSCPKPSMIKSRAVHDSNIDDPFVSFTFQPNLTNSELNCKFMVYIAFLIMTSYPFFVMSCPSSHSVSTTNTNEPTLERNVHMREYQGKCF
ncbi:unnamed protein product [Onchocerca flexuosa]|uniref:Ovule protein n=1 Tax=Onchocerca flexuosa TaxID=387005 RepID=A0A183HZ54_9BILA|nr:unnamed protein product [Onchocerca flexuosa]